MLPLTRNTLHQVTLLLLGTVFLGLPYVLYEPVINMPDGYDYLQLARNLAETGHYRTDLITPLSWSKVPQLMSHPDLWRAPVYPTILAAGFKLLGVGETVALGISGASFLLMVILSYHLMRRLTDTTTAFFAGVLLLSFDLIVRTGVTVLTESTYLFLLALSLSLVLYRDNHPYLFGLVSALAYLTRYNHWFLLAGMLYFALRTAEQSGKNYLGKFTVTFLLVLSPWLLRNVYYVGTPFYHHHQYLLAGHNTINPNFDVFLQFDPTNPIRFFLSHPGVVLTKWFRNLHKVYRWIPQFFSGTWPVALLAIWGYLKQDPEHKKATNALLTVFGIGFVLQTFFLAFVHVKARHFVPFILVVCFLAGLTLSNLYRKRRRLAIALTIGLLGLNGVTWISQNPWPASVSAQDYRAIQQYVPENEPVLTNAPELTAWYSERISLWYAPYKQVNRNYPEFNYVLLTPEARRNYSPRVSPEESYLRNEAFRNDFDRLKTFPSSKSRLYIRSSTGTDQLRNRHSAPKSDG